MADDKGNDVSESIEVATVINGGNHVKSKFVRQICSISVVTRILDWYQDLKTKSQLLSFAISPLEYFFLWPFLFITKQFGQNFSYVDEKVASIISVMVNIAGLSCHSEKKKATPVTKRKQKYPVMSMPVAFVIWCIDTVCNVSDGFLRKIQAYDQQQKMLEKTKQNKQKQPVGLNGLIGIVIYPLELYVSLMSYLRRWIHHFFDQSPWPVKALSPEKLAEIQARRKVSPRKKSRNLLVQLFGLGRPGKLEKISEELKGELIKSPNKEDGVEKKRKYEDVEGELESDENYGLGDSDMENYVSEEDPDYEPANGDSTDSEEYAEGQTESDIEFEYKDSTYQVTENSDKPETPSEAAAVKKNNTKQASSKTSSSNGNQTPVQHDLRTKLDIIAAEKAAAKRFVEGTPPVKTSTPKSKTTETKANQDSLQTEKKPSQMGKLTLPKLNSPQAKVKESRFKEVEEKATVQMQTNASNTDKKALLTPGKNVKCGSPQVKTKEGKEKSASFHEKCKDADDAFTPHTNTSATQKATTDKTSKQKGSKKSENQETVKESKLKGNDTNAEKSSADKFNGEKPKTEMANANLISGSFATKDNIPKK